MNQSEWRFVKILLLIVLLTALFPASAFVYRLLVQRELTPDALAQMQSDLLHVPPGTALSSATIRPGDGDSSSNKWTDFEVGDQGFAISIPETWQRLPMNPRDLSTLLDGMRSRNPDVANALDANAQTLIQTGIKFWAFDADPTTLKQNLMTTMTVLKRSLPGPTTLDTYVQVNVNQLVSLKTRVGALNQERTSLGNLPAVKLRYALSFTRADGSTNLSSQTQYLLVKDANAFVIGFTTIPEQDEYYSTVFERCASSFHILR
jgi:hypothetical protein